MSYVVVSSSTRGEIWYEIWDEVNDIWSVLQLTYYPTLAREFQGFRVWG